MPTEPSFLLAAGNHILPAPMQDHPLRLEYELPHLVLLRLLPGIDILPPDLGPARRAGDISDDVRPRHQGAGLGPPHRDVDEVGAVPRERGVRVRVGG